VGLERGPLSLVSTAEELFGGKGSGSGLESQEYGRRDVTRNPIYPQMLVLTSPTSGGRSADIVCLRTKGQGVCSFAYMLLSEGIRSSSVDTATGYGLGFISKKRQERFPYYTVFRPAQGPPAPLTEVCVCLWPAEDTRKFLCWGLISTDLFALHNWATETPKFWRTNKESIAGSESNKVCPSQSLVRSLEDTSALKYGPNL
jgi:hypothetical protein